MKQSAALAEKLRNQEVQWIRASDEAHAHSDDTGPTERALGRAELLWGVTELTKKFRELLRIRGISIYDRKMEHHFTGSAILLHVPTRRILMTFHPYYQIWQQLGGHEEGENHPVAIAAREAWEESGLDDVWVCDWPVRIDPHPAEKCKSVSGEHHNWHYDICYMSVTDDENFKISNESVDMRWVSLDELRELVAENKAQQRALEMATNALTLYDALAQLSKLPPN
jgi:8-oxo-dGTP pyrophosphatase MutT (NUDIX family)